MHQLLSAEAAINAVDEALGQPEQADNSTIPSLLAKTGINQADNSTIQQVVHARHPLLGELFDCLLSTNPSQPDGVQPSSSELQVWLHLKDLLLDPLPYSLFPDDYVRLWPNETGWTTPEHEVEQRYRTRLERRFDIARHLLHLRSFAKLDALQQRWPKLADRDHTDRNAFLEMEHGLQSGQSGAESWWMDLAGDEDLRQLVRLLSGARELVAVEQAPDLVRLVANLDNQLARLSPDASRPTSEDRIKAAGQILARALLGAKIEERIKEILANQATNPPHLRLVVSPHLSEVTELPWEALQAYLGGDGALPRWLHRRVPLPQEFRSIRPEMPLSIQLWLPPRSPDIHYPAWLNHFRMPLLQLERPSFITVQAGTLPDQHQQEMADFGSGVAHIVGTLSAEEKLVLQGFDPHALYLPLETLAQALAQAGTQLVGLTLFELTPSRAPVHFAESAERLVEAGVPVVVANHRQVSAEAAGVFYSTLYQALAENP